MLWEKLRRSNNVIDKRKSAVKKVGIVATLIASIAGLFIYNNPKLPTYITSNIDDKDKVAQATYTPEEHFQFIRALLAITEDQWKIIFAENNLKWQDSKLILFNTSTASSCGSYNTDIGPFYCSGDLTTYIDLDFFALLSNNLKVIGDASQAYIVFHEVGHHVQNLTGMLPRTFAKMQRETKVNANKLLVRLELQADCYAGIIFNKSKKLLEPGDVAEFINAASRIGDDWIQSRQGQVMPDSFTHGTSEQRAGWLLHGYKYGTIGSCDTVNQSDSIIKI